MVQEAEVAREGAYGVPSCRLVGAVAARRVSPPDYPLWLMTADIAAGGTLRWEGDQGDQALYVRSGGLEVDGVVCPPGGSLVIEGGATVTARVAVDTVVVHVGAGPSDRERPGTEGAAPATPTYHLVGPDGLHGKAEGAHAYRFFADSSCPTCRITLHWSSHAERYESAVHSHSADELIHVLEGEIFIGRRRVGPGDTLAVAAHTRYRFESGAAGYGFLNYSAVPSEYIPAVPT